MQIVFYLTANIYMWDLEWCGRDKNGCIIILFKKELEFVQGRMSRNKIKKFLYVTFKAFSFRKEKCSLYRLYGVAKLCCKIFFFGKFFFVTFFKFCGENLFIFSGIVEGKIFWGNFFL